MKYTINFKAVSEIIKDGFVPSPLILDIDNINDIKHALMRSLVEYQDGTTIEIKSEDNKYNKKWEKIHGMWKEM